MSFALPSTYTKGRREWWISRLFVRLIFQNLKSQPKIDDAICKRCGLCVDACPVGAIEGRGTEMSPRIEEEMCIQCFCCHEVCPHRAIDLKESKSLRIWRWLTDRRVARMKGEER